MAAKKNKDTETKKPKNRDTKIKLHLGGGTNYINGWTNIDNNLMCNIEKLDLDIDLTKSLPFENNSVDCVFYENFLEQLTPFEGLAALKDIRRVLKPNGTLRIEITDVNSVPHWYNEDIWEFDTDWEKLESLLKEAWFKDIKRCEYGKSQKTEFKDLTTQTKPALIAEAQKIRTKIPCFVLTFSDFDNTKKSIDFLTKYSDRLDIHVIGNHSEFTETKFRPYMLELLHNGKIQNYYAFDENIGVNALEIITRINAKDLYKYDYFMITDGNLISCDDCWLDELVEIIENNEELFAASADLDLSNLPCEDGYPDVKTWVQKAEEAEDKNYSEGAAGFWFSIYKTIDFFNIMEVLLKTNQRLLADSLFATAEKVFDKKWGRTKKSKAYNLSRDSGLEQTPVWDQDKYCNYTLFNVSGVNYFTVNRKITEAPKLKLHIGCGTQYKEGWINIDNNSDNNITKLDLNWDLRDSLPYEDNSVDFIYNEHFLEHLDVQEGVKSLTDFHRVLKPGGILRIAMPDLEAIIKEYFNPNWQDNPVLKQYGLYFKTRAERLNVDFRAWGHQWLYDYEELERRLREAGFSEIKRCKLYQSENDNLCNLETRGEASSLIAEAVK